MAKLNYRARDRYGRGVGQIGPTSKDMLEDLQRDMQNRATSIGDIINIASTIISGVNLAQTVKESGFKEALKEQFNPTIEFDGKTFELNPEDVYKEVDRKGIKSLLPDFRDRIVIYSDINSLDINKLQHAEKDFSKEQIYELSLKRFCDEILYLVNN